MEMVKIKRVLMEHGFGFLNPNNFLMKIYSKLVMPFFKSTIHNIERNYIFSSKNFCNLIIIVRDS